MFCLCNLFWGWVERSIVKYGGGKHLTWIETTEELQNRIDALEVADDQFEEETADRDADWGELQKTIHQMQRDLAGLYTVVTDLQASALRQRQRTDRLEAIEQSNANIAELNDSLMGLLITRGEYQTSMIDNLEGRLSTVEPFVTDVTALAAELAQECSNFAAVTSETFGKADVNFQFLGSLVDQAQERLAAQEGRLDVLNAEATRHQGWLVEDKATLLKVDSRLKELEERGFKSMAEAKETATTRCIK